MIREKSAGAIIFRKEEGKMLFLLLHYESGHWDFVKGHIEENEEEKETIRRETEEETGIRDLNFIDGFKETISYFYKKDGKTIFKEVVFYLAETKTKDVKISFEHKGYSWLEYRDALRKATFKTAKNLLEKAYSFLKEKGEQKSIQDF
ncbi:MAG: NUDIX domain-containing protein [Candidatus Woesearchaeota archaeon]|nr:NUDIX domain-containing protein [Candidatus Woesearchaeota archaeon]